MPRVAFISTWGKPSGPGMEMPFHVTEMGNIFDADFMGLTTLGRSIPLGEIKLKEYDLVFIITRMVNSTEDLRYAKIIIEHIRLKYPNTKIVTSDIEGVDYYEKSHLGGRGYAPNVLVNLAKVIAGSDLALTGSESHATVLQALACTDNVEVFGFIPTHDEVYEGAYHDTLGKRTNKVGIGAKAGPARRGCSDIIAVGKWGGTRASSSDCPQIVPLTNGRIVHEYKELAKYYGMDIVWNEGLSYSDYLKSLCELDFVINLDTLAGCSRLAYECARMGVPCIGSKHSYYQNLYFPELSVYGNDMSEVYRRIEDAMSGSWYNAKMMAQEDNRENHITDLYVMLDAIGVDLYEL